MPQKVDSVLTKPGAYIISRDALGSRLPCLGKSKRFQDLFCLDSCD